MSYMLFAVHTGCLPNAVFAIQGVCHAGYLPYKVITVQGVCHNGVFGIQGVCHRQCVPYKLYMGNTYITPYMGCLAYKVFGIHGEYRRVFAIQSVCRTGCLL